MGMSAQDSQSQYGTPAYTGWDPNAAAADHAANPNKFSNSSSSSSGDSTSSTKTPVDVAGLSKSIASAVHPYYQSLIDQANGNFSDAVKLMQADYQQGTYQAKQNLAYSQKYGTDALNQALGTLGVTFQGENNDAVSGLNQRGMAVYQNNPDGSANVVTPTKFTPNTDTSNFTYGSNLSTPPNTTNLGQGGTEIAKLQSDQSLRAEATMRAQMQPLEQAGITYKQTTNPGTGFNPNDPLAYKGDPSTLGTTETQLMGASNTANKTRNSAIEDVNNQQQSSINSLTSQYAQTQSGALDANQQNTLKQQYNANNFVTGGNTTG